MGVIWHAIARAQTSPDALQQYFSNGADFTSVPAPGQPGAEYFSNGAECMNVPAPGQPGAGYFSNGADFTSVPAAGQPGAEYFSTGAALTSVPAPGEPGAGYFSNGAAFTSVPAPGQPGAEYFSNGAAFTSVPAPGQPGGDYFSSGADFTSVPSLGQPGGGYWYGVQTQSVPMPEGIATPDAPFLLPAEQQVIEAAPQPTPASPTPTRSAEIAPSAEPASLASTEVSIHLAGSTGATFDVQSTPAVPALGRSVVVASAEAQGPAERPVSERAAGSIATRQGDRARLYELVRVITLWTLANTTALAVSMGCVVVVLTMLGWKVGASRRRVRHP
ncbi:MAG: hypothetical protein ACHQ53_07365 [Polyangiales bacterium]